MSRICAHTGVPLRLFASLSWIKDPLLGQGRHRLLLLSALQDERLVVLSLLWMDWIGEKTSERTAGVLNLLRKKNCSLFLHGRMVGRTHWLRPHVDESVVNDLYWEDFPLQQIVDACIHQSCEEEEEEDKYPDPLETSFSSECAESNVEFLETRLPQTRLHFAQLGKAVGRLAVSQHLLSVGISLPSPLFTLYSLSPDRPLIFDEHFGKVKIQSLTNLLPYRTPEWALRRRLWKHVTKKWFLPHFPFLAVESSSETPSDSFSPSSPLFSIPFSDLKEDHLARYLPPNWGRALTFQKYSATHNFVRFGKSSRGHGYSEKVEFFIDTRTPACNPSTFLSEESASEVLGNHSRQPHSLAAMWEYTDTSGQGQFLGIHFRLLPESFYSWIQLVMMEEGIVLGGAEF